MASFSEMTVTNCQMNLLPGSSEDTAAESLGLLDPRIRVTGNTIRFQVGNPSNLLGRFINSLLVLPPVPQLLGLKAAQTVYARLQSDRRPVLPPFEPLETLLQNPKIVSAFQKALDAFEITPRTDMGALFQMPRSGPVVVVANHPLSGVEGIAIGAEITRIRPDVKVMVNHLLGVIPELRANLILANPFGGESASIQNRRMFRESIEWLRSGHVLVVFPAGAISNRLPLWRRGSPDARLSEDPEWNQNIFRMIVDFKAAVLPAYVPGEPGIVIDLLRKLSPYLGMPLMIREMVKLRGKTITIHFGNVIRPEVIDGLSRFGTSLVVDTIRTATYSLRTQSTRKAPFAPETDETRAAYLHEKTSLSKDQILIDRTNYLVYSTKGFQAPYTLYEMGRLREMAFRSLGEGSGFSADIDHYDSHYTHIVLLDRRKERIAGGYRIGPIQEILENHGSKGLYTSTLFEYDTLLEGEFRQGLELGRSFVVREYRGSGLALLWKGIGEYVAKRPWHRYLVGPVSVSQDFSEASRSLIFSYLHEYQFDEDRAKKVKPKNEIDFPLLSRSQLQDLLKLNNSHTPDQWMTAVIEKVKDLEGPKGLPFPELVSHYFVKLGAKAICFQKDPEFQSTDALVVVDLTKIAPRQLLFYLGEEGSKKFLAYHTKAS